MRDPARIPIILEQIRKIWEQHPDLRLCQLIGNVFPGGDNYYREDELLSDRLTGQYGELAGGQWRKNW